MRIGKLMEAIRRHFQGLKLSLFQAQPATLTSQSSAMSIVLHKLRHDLLHWIECLHFQLCMYGVSY